MCCYPVPAVISSQRRHQSGLRVHLYPTIQGLGTWRNQLVLATSTGLYALDADTDAGATINWEFRSGFSHLGTDRLKRVRDVNVLARGAGDVPLIYVLDRYGQKQEAKYKLTKLTADAFRDQVIKAGQGYQSVYWQMGCQGGVPAEIDELRVAVEPLEPETMVLGCPTYSGLGSNVVSQIETQLGKVDRIASNALNDLQNAMIGLEIAATAAVQQIDNIPSVQAVDRSIFRSTLPGSRVNLLTPLQIPKG